MKTLLAIDGSDCAYQAAEFLCRLPHHEALDIEVLTTINTPDVSSSTSTKAWLPEFMEQLNSTADAAYTKVVNCFEGSTATLHQHKASGHAGQAIVNRGEEIGADLIVLGAKGHSPVARILLGSVSDYVGRHASCGVLTVRPAAENAPPAERLRVTIAYDGSAPSKQALKKFLQFGWRKTVDVQVLGVVTLFPLFPGEGEELLNEQVKQDWQDAQQNVDEIVQQLQAAHINASGKVVKADHVGEAIVLESKANDSELILLGNTGRSLLPRLLLGSVSAYVQRHAHQSVWIAR